MKLLKHLAIIYFRTLKSQVRFILQNSLIRHIMKAAQVTGFGFIIVNNFHLFCNYVNGYPKHKISQINPL